MRHCECKVLWVAVGRKALYKYKTVCHLIPFTHKVEVLEYFPIIKYAFYFFTMQRQKKVPSSPLHLFRLRQSLPDPWACPTLIAWMRHIFILHLFFCRPTWMASMTLADLGYYWAMYSTHFTIRISQDIMLLGSYRPAAVFTFILRYNLPSFPLTRHTVLHVRRVSYVPPEQSRAATKLQWEVRSTRRGKKDEAFFI